MAKVESTHAAGQTGEHLARAYLEHRGLEIVETNYRFGRGEIDIIAREGEYLVFCEVKMRTTDEYGPPELAVTRRKRQQVRRLAQGYLAERRIVDQACRFDVVAIVMKGGLPQIEYFPNAF